MILGRFQQPLQLLLPVIVRNVPLLLGALHLVGGVEGNQVHFDGLNRFNSVVKVRGGGGCGYVLVHFFALEKRCECVCPGPALFLC